jgi:hypothetical protein
MKKIIVPIVLLVISLSLCYIVLGWQREHDQEAAQTEPQKTILVENLKKIFMHQVGEYSYAYLDGKELKIEKANTCNSRLGYEYPSIPKAETVMLVDAKPDKMYLEIQVWNRHRCKFIFHIDPSEAFEGAEYSPSKNQTVRTQVVR